MTSKGIKNKIITESEIFMWVISLFFSLLPHPKEVNNQNDDDWPIS